VSHFSRKVAKDLKLEKHGFDSGAGPLATIGLNAGGEHVVLQDGQFNALSAANVASGAEIRYNAKVTRVLVDGDADGLHCKGVQLDNGEKIEATRVISGIDPKRSFLDLVGRFQ
jgi:hypothetical protein